MSLNQDIRSRPPSNDVNNPLGLFNYLIVGKKLKGNGPPSNNVGTINSTYIDEDTGIEYVKSEAGVWDAYVNYSNVGPDVPDPLSVDTIQGRTGESLLLDMKTTGDLNINLGFPTHALDINSGSVRLTANGNGVFASDVVGYSVIANTGGGKTISLDANSGIVDHVGSQPFEITNSTVNQGLILSTSGAGQIDVNSAGNASINSTSGDVIVNTPSGDVTVNSSGDATINSSTGNATVNAPLGKINLVSDSGSGGGTVCDGWNFTFQNSAVHAGGERIEIGPGGISFRTPGGQASLVNEVAGDILIAPQMGSEVNFNSRGINFVTSINDSSSLTNNSMLNVNPSGTLSWRTYPRSIQFLASGWGGNGTSYFHLGDSTINPGELWGACTGNGRNLAEIDFRLHYNAPFTLTGGSAVVEIGYVANNQPMTQANFTLLRSANLTTGSPLYGVSFTGYNDVIPFRAALCVRTVLTGTSATATNAEVSILVTIV